ncbi:receptor-like protein 5 [Brassica napus]|uniref:receptor-like protein 5 n=1 Tax=Brassica napus TaxID=3708 RepID=UPI0020786AE8|nr:receptor-like protein 5 [Brassica napus]
MDDQWRPGSPHYHSPPPCQAHHGDHTAEDCHNEADRLYTRARIDVIGRQLSGVPPLPPFYHHSTRPRGLLMRNLYFYVLCFCTFAVVKAGSSPQNNTGIRLDALFAILGDFGYHPVLAETWKGNSPCDNWFGLICVEGHIKYIFLMSMNLTGSISPRFADLTSVHVIDLSQNLLTGTIPFELTKMKLRFLDLSHNQLHGKIPRFQTLVPVTEGNPEIVTAAGIIRVPLGRGDKETAGVGGFYVWIMVLGFVLIGGAVFLFYLAKKLNHPV